MTSRAEESGIADATQNPTSSTEVVQESHGDHLPHPESPVFKPPQGRCSAWPASMDYSSSGADSGWPLATPIGMPPLVNLSFSQPNSPRTPRVCRGPPTRPGTPTGTAMLHRQGEENVLNTPCVTSALRELQMAQDTGLPELLALIEDEEAGVHQVERQLLHNTEVELTDQNVVDYLLDLASHDDLLPPAHRQAEIPSHCGMAAVPPIPAVPQISEGLNVRRQRHGRSGQKRMTEEEARVIRKLRATRAARASLPRGSHTSGSVSPERSRRHGRGHAQQQQEQEEEGEEEEEEEEVEEEEVVVESRSAPSPVQLPTPVARSGGHAEPVTSAAASSVASLSPSTTKLVVRRSKRSRQHISRFEVHW